jgi:hypothetical protein
VLDFKLGGNSILDFWLDNDRDSMKELLNQFTGMSKLPRRAVPSFDPGICLLVATMNAFVAFVSSLKISCPSVPPCYGEASFASLVSTVDNTLFLIKKDACDQIPVKNLQAVPLSSRERAADPNDATGANTNTNFVVEAGIVVLVAAPAFLERAWFFDWAMDAIKKERLKEPVS